MTIKKVAIFFLWFAQAIILGHNFFSHHHHHTPHSTHSHANGHHHHHSDANDDDSKVFGHLFSFVQHLGDQLSFTNPVSTDISIAQDFSQPVVAAFQGHVFMLAYNSVCKQHAFPPGQCELFESLHLFFYDLRGPPSFIVS